MQYNDEENRKRDKEHRREIDVFDDQAREMKTSMVNVALNFKKNFKK